MFCDTKLQAEQDICGKENISLENVAYIGVGVNAIELFFNVGFAFCPQMQ